VIKQLLKLVPVVVALGFGVRTQSAVPPATREPQGRDTYVRAEALLGQNLDTRVRNAFIVPHRIGGTDEFWYRRERANGTDSFIVDAATGRRRPCPSSSNTCSQKPETPDSDGLLWSPHRDRAVATREGNLYLTEGRGSATRALTSDGAPDAGYGIWTDNWSANAIPRQRSGNSQAPIETQWAPDSRTLLVPFLDQRHVEPYPMLESAPADGSFRPRVHAPRLALVGERSATFEWRLVDTQGGSTRRVDLPYDKLLEMQQDITAFRGIGWKRDSSHLYLVAHGANMASAYLFDVEVVTGKARTVLVENMAPRMDLNSTSYNPVNVRVVRDGRELIWFSQRDGWGHLYRYDVVTGNLINRITRGNWLVRDIIDIDEKRGVIYFTGGGREPGNPYYRYLYSVNFDGSSLKLLSPETADHLLLPEGRFVLSFDNIVAYPPVSPSGRFVVYNYSRVDEPPRFVIRRVADASLVAEVEKADTTELFAAGWRPPEEFVVKAADGTTDLWGVLYEPSNFDPTQKYPIIDAQYASPLTAVVPRNFYTAYRGIQPIAPSSYAELGFIVVCLDARGTAYRSRSFSQAGYGEMNRDGLDDHVAAIRSLARVRAYLDVDRVGIIGHSYGGFAALRAMLEFPDFFKVGISSAAMADSQGMYTDYHMTAFQGLPRYRDGSRWRPLPAEVPSNWAALDASAQAGQLRGKLLLQLGELDENVLSGQMLQFAAALMRANEDFELLYLPGQDHQFIGQPYVMRRDWDFMVRYLLGREPPAGYAIAARGR